MQKLPPIPKLSASLLLVKENMKILFMQRPPTGSFANMWAFPGGNCDKLDSELGYQDTFKVTALREAFEELGMLVGECPKQPIMEFSSKHLPDPKLLIPLIRLITIQNLPRRYDTRYYVAFQFGNGKGDFMDHENLTKNNNEVVKYRWLTPLEALSLYKKSEMQMAPPQFIILNILAGFKDTKSLQSYLGTLEQQFAPYLIHLTKNDTNSYPFVSYNTFDHLYPIKQLVMQEQLALKEEMNSLQEFKPEWRNRVYFSDRNQIFMGDFEVDIKLPFESPFNKMVNSKEMMRMIAEANLAPLSPKL